MYYCFFPKENAERDRAENCRMKYPKSQSVNYLEIKLMRTSNI